MKRLISALVMCASLAISQDINPPPTITTPAFTQSVPVVVTSTVTQMVVNVQTQVVYSPVVITTATLRVFTVYIDDSQNPQGFLSRFSDGSVVVTPAANVGSLSNRPALSMFNDLLADVIVSGRRCVNTNAMWQRSGTNAAGQAFTHGARTNQWNDTGR